MLTHHVKQNLDNHEKPSNTNSNFLLFNSFSISYLYFDWRIKKSFADKYTHLGSTFSSNVHTENAKASLVFGRFHENVWGRKEIRFDTKLKVYLAMIMTARLCAFKTCTIYKLCAKRLNHFQLCLLNLCMTG